MSVHLRGKRCDQQAQQAVSHHLAIVPILPVSSILLIFYRLAAIPATAINCLLCRCCVVQCVVGSNTYSDLETLVSEDERSVSSGKITVIVRTTVSRLLHSVENAAAAAECKTYGEAIVSRVLYGDVRRMSRSRIGYLQAGLRPTERHVT